MKTIFSAQRQTVAQQIFVSVYKECGRLKYKTFLSRDKRDEFEANVRQVNKRGFNPAKLFYRITITPCPEMKSVDLMREKLIKQLNALDRASTIQ